MENSATGLECRLCRTKQDEIDRLKLELAEWRQRCQLAEDESRRARDDLRALEGEMDELHDNFKEEESEQFEQVKQELDGALKNCKILQIRLQKSERQYSQLEQVKSILEKQISESQAVNATSQQQQKQQQQNSLNIQEASLCEVSGDYVKVPTCEYDQLLRDLNDTSERERDLQEQVKYSQEEAQLKGERLQAVEAENEILLGRINKLTLTNSSLRSSLLSPSSMSNQSQAQNESNQATETLTGLGKNKVRELCEQNEQLKLALEVAQSECERLKARLAETQQTFKALEKTPKRAEASLQVGLAGDEQDGRISSVQLARVQTGQRELEFEARQLRARLAHSERERRQLRSQLELKEEDTRLGNTNSTQTGSSAKRASVLGATARSQSMELDQEQQCGSRRCQKVERQLEQQCRALLERNNELETKLQRLIELSSQDLDQKTTMELDLFEKLKRQLETSESELAKAKSRLVELDIECGRAQRQYKRLLVSLERCGSAGGELQALHRHRLPAESARDSMSRQDLRQALRELESDVDELTTMLKAKEGLIKELQSSGVRIATTTAVAAGDESASEQQLKSMRRLLDQERLLSNNLKLDVANLERDNIELVSRRQMLERERVAMEEELDKLRQLSGEFRAELEESEREKQLAVNKSRELSETVERLRFELDQSRKLKPVAGETNSSASTTVADNRLAQGFNLGTTRPASPEILLMERDLSELKVKNGFLMRQLEIAREDTIRQLDELRTTNETQQRRAVEMAQIVLKERHLQEAQALRDELNDCKQRLAAMQRQLARQDEEVTLERERVRAIERDWRRDKSHWQQTRTQLEGQLALEKRSNEFQLKEVEAAQRDKERQLTSLQDRCVQLERDLKRVQGKYKLLEEDSDSKLKRVVRDLELKSKELAELSSSRQLRDEQQYEMLKQLSEEKAALREELEATRHSLDEKMVEARQLRELLVSRQEQSYKERALHFEQLDAMTNQLGELSEQANQSKLLKQRLELQERQLESCRRDLAQLREERARLTTRCEQLEKRELIAKTTTISSGSAGVSGASIFKPFGSARAQLLGVARASGASDKQGEAGRVSASASVGGGSGEQSMCEKLSGKINDQRNLINILKRQLNETQLELKQLKLLEASERSQWRARVVFLTGRLNESEEKLAYETGLLNKSSIMINSLASSRLEASWSRERQASQELIQQQQSQIELLARDLKKTSAAHNLLRLQAKQLESHNSKLTRKLIEHQQQSNIFSLQDHELEQSHERLVRTHERLQKETRPLLDIVGKIVASLEAPPPPLKEHKAKEQSNKQLDSTERPLRAGSIEIRRDIKRENDDNYANNDNDNDNDDNDDNHNNVDIHKLARPAHQSRLTRLLAGGVHAKTPATNSTTTADGQSRQQAADSKTVKRVRVKCSTLGITTSEKKQLKAHLKSLAVALAPAGGDKPKRGQEEARQDNKPEDFDSSIKRASLELSLNSRRGQQSQRTASSVQENASNNNVSNKSDRLSSSANRVGVHWQLSSTQDSDLESDSSLSLALDRAADSYRRFPQASPAGLGRAMRRGHSAGPTTSLTDYESESSLASDYSVSVFGPRRLGANLPSGAESDGGGGGGGGSLAKGRRKKSAGFKGRLTNTLRNISRSITGGLSASDAEQMMSTDSGRIHNDLKEISV